MTEGVLADGTGDSYAPPHSIEILATTMGLPPRTPVVHTVDELAWTGLSPLSIPPGGLSGDIGGGLASGVLAQWVPANGDGHFVVYTIPAAMNQAAVFLENLGADPVGLVPPP
jgi:hypothetical protein